MNIKRTTKDIYVEAPWGKIALATWGDPKNTPVLLTHGFMDSAATFFILMEHLPDNYYYVALDIPGHGKSDYFPPGLLMSQIHVIEAVRIVVDTMRWKRFIYLGHSMGCSIGAFYNNLFPNRISRMIFIEPGPPFAVYYYVHHRVQLWYKYLYDDYYKHYGRFSSSNPNQYDYEQIVNLLVRTRSLTEEQAEVVISRSLVPVGNDKYKLSWDNRMKKIATIPVSEDTFFHILTTNIPPTLVIGASEITSIQPGTDFAGNILQKCQQLVPNFTVVEVAGGHDIHITSPDATAPHIVDFLSKNFDQDIAINKL